MNCLALALSCLTKESELDIPSPCIDDAKDMNGYYMGLFEQMGVLGWRLIVIEDEMKFLYNTRSIISGPSKGRLIDPVTQRYRTGVGHSCVGAMYDNGSFQIEYDPAGDCGLQLIQDQIVVNRNY